MSQDNADNVESTDVDHTDENTLRRLYNKEDLSTSQIGERAGVSPETVRYWMEKHGIDRRSREDALRERISYKYAPYYVNNNGHATWRNHHDGQYDTVCVHRLLAVSEFGYDAVAGNDVHHKNGVPWDNRASNIEPLSHGDHMTHHNQGENNASSKIDTNDAEEIKRRIAEGESQATIADDYPIGLDMIRQISNGFAWTHVNTKCDTTVEGWTCPECRGRNPNDETTCGRCGVEIPDRWGE